MKKNYKKSVLFLGLMSVLAMVSNLFLTPALSDDISKLPYTPIIFPGDLIFMEYKNEIIQDVGFTSNDHVALYIGNNMCVSAGFVLNPYNTVDYVPLSYYTGSNFSSLKLGRVITATGTIRNAAVSWAIARIGSPYQEWFGEYGFPHPEKCANPNNPLVSTSGQWYCSELVWAAYYNQGIDIDNNGWGILPYYFPCVNMGLPVMDGFPPWVQILLNVFGPYKYKNEIQIDNDIQMISWT